MTVDLTQLVLPEARAEKARAALSNDIGWIVANLAD